MILQRRPALYKVSGAKQSNYKEQEMKMDIFFGNLFWGILFVLIGLSIVLKSFGFKIPLVTTFIAIIIIMFGVKILIGAYKKPTGRGITTKEISASHREYTSVFSSSRVVLDDLTPQTKYVEVTAVFGSSTVYLPSNIDFEVESNAVFGSVVTPSKTESIIGSSRQNLGEGKQKVRLEANAIFGRLEFIIQDVVNPAAPNDSTAAPSGF
jgi:predicted membrane protein